MLLPARARDNSSVLITDETPQEANTELREITHVDNAWALAVRETLARLFTTTGREVIYTAVSAATSVRGEIGKIQPPVKGGSHWLFIKDTSIVLISR